MTVAHYRRVMLAVGAACLDDDQDMVAATLTRIGDEFDLAMTLGAAYALIGDLIAPGDPRAAADALRNLMVTADRDASAP